MTIRHYHSHMSGLDCRADWSVINDDQLGNERNTHLDTADLSPSVAARHACRTGMAATTAGVANGFVQGNLVILPEKLAGAFHRFCQLNPKPCPIIGMSDVGNPRIPALGLDLDIRTDVPRYRVWRDGEVVEEPTDITAHWRDDLVAFVIGCSYLVRGGAAGGRPADPPHRAQTARADVPHQHRLRRGGAVRGADGGVDAAVQAGGCDPRGADHLALSLRARRAGSSRPSAFDRHRRHRQARLRRCGAGRGGRDSGVLGLRRDAAIGDRGSQGCRSRSRMRPD